MYYFIINYEIIPEKVIEADQWLKETGVTFWASQDCVERVSLLKHIFSSSPKRTLMIEVTSLNALQRVLESHDRIDKRENYEKYIRNEWSYVSENIMDQCDPIITEEIPFEKLRYI